MWYAVLRKQERDVFIGTLVLRHAATMPPCCNAAGRRSPVEEIARAGRAGPTQAM